MTIDDLQAKRDEMQTALTSFIEQANRQIAAIEGRIAMLDELIAEQGASANELAADSD